MGSGASRVEYSFKYSDPDGPGFSSIYRARPNQERLIESPYENCLTMRELLLRSHQKYANNNFFGYIDIARNANGDQIRTVRNLTFDQCIQRAQRVGSGILGLNLNSSAEDLTYVKSRRMNFVGIYSKNRIEWGLVDLACTLYGITTVPLYDTLGVENLTYCLEQTNLTTCFCTAQTAPSLLKLKSHGKLSTVILFDTPQNNVLADLQKKFKIVFFQELVTAGQKRLIDFNSIRIQPTDCLTFSYTSGTTGPPKGAMLSHINFTAGVASLMNAGSGDFLPTDVYLSFLPLPHIFQRIVLAGCIYGGTNVVFYSGDVQKIKDDAQTVKPTLFVAVPRLYNKIVQGVEKKVADKGGVSKCLFDNGMESKRAQMEKDGDYSSFFYDKVVFSNTREAFGGRIRLMITGSAPITKEVHSFMKAIMGCGLIEGYGQTENTAAAFVQLPKDPNLGQVGGITTGLQFKLADIPEMNYFHTDRNEKGQQTPRGEIWLRGPQVFLGYYKNPEKTQEALTSDGWLRTGDVGMLLPGFRGMKLIDRKKNIFKLAQGQYIASEKVESAYSKCPMVAEAFLHGDSHQNFAVAVLSLKQNEAIKFARSKGMNGSFEEICRSKEMRTEVCKEIDLFGKKAGLNSFEQAKNVWLQPKAFSDLGITTNTFKLQRFHAKKHYAEQIQIMYKEGMLPIK